MDGQPGRDRRRGARPARGAGHEGAPHEPPRGLRRTPEQLAATREHKAQLFAHLQEALAGDPDATALLDETLQDHTTAAEQAEALGWPIERVRNARKRLNRAIEALEAEDAAPESERSWDAADQDSKVDSGVES
jgi:hypothetical protein